VSAPLLVAYRALGLGDLLTAVPALRALARAFPDHHRVLAAPAALAELAALTGAVDELVDVPPLVPLPQRLHGADIAVNLHGRGPQSHAVLRAAEPRRMIAFRDPAADESSRAPVWRAGEHEVRRWCRLLDESGIPADPADLRIAAPDVEPPVRRATIIHPGAASGARRWPAERWAAVARAAERVVITGDAAERDLALEVAHGVPGATVLAGRTSLLELAATVAAAERVVCGDTGIAHLATAFGTPSIVLFGPTPPAEWGPPDDPRHVVLWAGRRGDPHGEEPDQGLLAIEVEQVLDRLAA
jgi:ADP-heptose:LPS heptosyltransferase